MADQATSLPVRSEADGTDERLQSKLVDATNPDTQQLEINTDSQALVEVHGDNPAGGDETLRLSELGAPNGDGDYDATNNTKPASSGVVGHDRGASIDETSQNQRVTAVAGDNDKVAMDVAIQDSSGNDITESNPLFVSFSENPGAEIVNYDTAAAVAKDASDNHDYTVSGGTTLLVDELWASASGKMKIEVQLETAAASGVFNTIFVGFNSTSNPNIRIPGEKIVKQVAGAIVRIIRTNLDNQAQDLYSTVVGIEK